MRRKISKTKLALAVALAMSIGGSVMAAEYNGRIIGDLEKDKAVFGDVISLTGNTETFNFNENTTINGYYGWQEMAAAPYYITTGDQGWLATVMPGGMYSVNYKPEGPHNDIVFDMNGHDLTVNHEAQTGVGQIGVGAGAYVASTALAAYTPNKIEINNVGKLTLKNHSTGYYVSGLYAGYYRGAGSEAIEMKLARPTIHIHNGPGWENAVVSRAGGAQYAENMTGIKVFNRGEIIVDGYVDFGTGSLDVNTAGERKETSAHFKVGGGRWGGIYGYGNSLLELNTEMDAQGNVRALENEIMMEGDIQTKGTFSFDITKVHLAIVGPNSYWKGIIKAGNDTLEHLFLKKDGTWHVMGSWASTINHLHGGDTAAEAGVIRLYSKMGYDRENILAKDYDGNIIAMYERKRWNPVEIAGKDLIIEKAKPGSSIIMQTDANGLNLDDSLTVDKVLEGLANKLVYKGYMDGERNLTAQARIAEGLTSSSAVKNIGDIFFDESNGLGRYLKLQKTNYTTTLTGGADNQEYLDSGLLLGEGNIAAKDPISIQVENAPAIDVKANVQLKNDVFGKKWTINSSFADKGTVIQSTGNSSLEFQRGGDINIHSKGKDIVVVYAGEKDGVSGSGKVDFGYAMDSYKNMITFTQDIPDDGHYTLFKTGESGKIQIKYGFSIDTGEIKNVTVMDASDGGQILLGNTKMLRTKDYLAKVDNGGWAAIDAQASDIYGDIWVVDGENKRSLAAVTIQTNHDWHGGIHGGGYSSIHMLGSMTSKGDDIYKGVWYNEWQNPNRKNLDSEVSKIVLGRYNNDNEAWIYQKSEGKITVHKLDQGRLNIFYEHDDKDITTIKGGDTIIESGDNNGNIVALWTNKDNIQMDDSAQVNSVLEALAGKLVYSGYADGERNIEGRVGIEEGLLTSKVTKMLAGGPMSFDGETGRGYYLPQTQSQFSQVLTGGTDQVYADAGVKDGENYDFKMPSTIAVEYTNQADIMGAIAIASGKNVNIISSMNDVAVKTDTSQVSEGITAGIAVIPGGHLLLKPKTVTIDVKSGTEKTYGIYAAGFMTDTEPVEALKVDTTDPSLYQRYNTKNLALDIKGTSTKGEFVGIYADNKALLNIIGRVNIEGDKLVGIQADHGAQVVMNTSDGLNSGSYRPVNTYINAEGGIAARAGRGATIRLPYLQGKDEIIGDIVTEIDGEAGNVVLQMNGQGTWHGSVNSPEHFDLYLLGEVADDKRSLWINEWQQGSGDAHVANLYTNQRSDHYTGVIYQKSPEDLYIHNLVGGVSLYFDHGEEPWDIKGGDVHIQKVSLSNGWTPTMMVAYTGLEGVDLENESMMNKVLDALAHKLYFTGEAAKWSNPQGYVSIREKMRDRTAPIYGEGMHFSNVTIQFDKRTGQGFYYYASARQIGNEFTSALTGHNLISDDNRDTRYQDHEYAVLGVIKPDGSYEFTTPEGAVANRIQVAEPYTITVGEDAAARETVAGITAEDLDINIKADNVLDVTAQAVSENTDAAGIHVAKDVTLAMAADHLVIHSESEKGNAYGIINEGTFSQAKRLSVKQADIGIRGDAGTATLAQVETEATKVGVQAATDATVTIGGGNIKGSEAALRSLGGTIGVNQDGANDVQVQGDVEAANEGTVDLTLANEGSQFVGTVRNLGGNVNLALRNGGFWDNVFEGKDDNLRVNHLTGGDTRENAGVIHQHSDSQINIDNYSGHVRFLFEHNEAKPDHILGGNVTIGNAAAGSAVELFTDPTGIGTGNEAVGEVFEALANKLTYTGYPNGSDNLQGKVGIAEGLLTSSRALKIADMEFDRTGKGHLKGAIYDIEPDTGESVVHDSDIIYGPKQTAMMRGAKSAMASTAMLWRATVNDVQKRLGELRDADQAEAGLWARIGAGRMSYDNDYTEYKTDFTDYYLGYDKEIGNSGWRIGAAVNHLDGDAKYEFGDGDSKVTTLNLYASKVNDDGSYFDIIARGGRAKADYTIVNQYGKTLKGDYKTNGMALSVEYGKRMERDNGFYIEPQVELSWSRLAAKSYDAHSDYYGGVNLRVDQEAFDSLIGRVGVGFGMRNDKGHVYAKVSALHEFEGDFDTSYQAPTEEKKTTHLELDDTWINVSLGGNYSVKDDMYIYGNLEKSFSGDVQLDWRANVGVRWMF